MHIISYAGRMPQMVKVMPDTTIAVAKCYDAQCVYMVYFHAATGAVRSLIA